MVTLSTKLRLTSTVELRASSARDLFKRNCDQIGETSI